MFSGKYSVCSYYQYRLQSLTYMYLVIAQYYIYFTKHQRRYSGMHSYAYMTFSHNSYSNIDSSVLFKLRLKLKDICEKVILELDETHTLM